MPESIELSHEKCLELLTAGIVGRVAGCTPTGPFIQPVNYSVMGECVVFRTSPYGMLGTQRWPSPLVFEIDHLDYEQQRGWSVIAAGHGSRIEDPAEIESIRRRREPRPWAGGARALHIRLRWTTLSGRRLGATGWTHENELPVRRYP